MKNQQVLFIVGGVILLAFLAREQARAAANAIANINQGTPFEGTGPIGTIGHAADTVSGGLLSRAGSAIGEFFSGSFFDRRTLDDF